MSTPLPWETLRAAYLERFGALFDAHASADGAYYLLQLWTPAPPDAPMVYATFAASWTPFAHELVLPAALSFPPFRHVLEALVRKGPAGVVPLGIVPVAVPGTRFEALLVLPEADGTFTLGDAEGAPCQALRVVPITGAERRHAELDPLRLLARLRAAGALVADPARDCVIAPRGIAPRVTREALLATMKQTFDGIDAIARDAWSLVATPSPLPAEVLVSAAVVEWSSMYKPAWSAADRELLATILPPVERALAPLRRMLPQPFVDWMEAVIVTVLWTHPDAADLTGRDVAGMRSVERVRRELVDIVQRTQPRPRPEDLLAETAEGLERARAAFDPRDGVPFENDAWRHMLHAMSDSFWAEPWGIDIDDVTAFVAHVADFARRLSIGPDDRPAPERLDEIAVRIATSMYRCILVRQRAEKERTAPPAAPTPAGRPRRPRSPKGRERTAQRSRGPGRAAGRDIARAAYEERFGPVHYVDEGRGDDGHVIYETVVFWERGAGRAPRVVRATLGLAWRPARSEVWIASVVPRLSIDSAIGALAEVNEPLAPLQVVPFDGGGETLFEAALVLPIEDGAVVLGEAGGAPRHALRVTLLTPAERRLAEREPGKLLEGLRRAGALVVDPLRDCSVAPEETRARRWSVERDLVDRNGKWLYRGLAMLAKLDDVGGGPACLVERQHRMSEEQRAVLAFIDDAGAAVLPERHAPYSFHRAAPPSPERVARRALVLAALVYRSHLEVGTPPAELGLAERPELDREGRRRELWAWLAALGLDREAEPAETGFLAAPVGTVDLQAATLVAWKVHALHVLAWALGRLELPDVAMGTELADAVRAVGLLGDDARALVAAPVLRGDAERRALLERVYAVHWRLARFAEDEEPMDFACLGEVPRFWFGTLAVGGLALADRDLTLEGRPLDDFQRTSIETFCLRLEDRHRAASWLAGLHPLLSQSPCKA